MEQPEKLIYSSFDNDQFDYLKWTNSTTPQTVIIGVHGINGAAQDYDNLASYLTENHQSITIYAPETRGQGNDRNIKRRGDIYRTEEWFKDLRTFTLMVKTNHPDAEIIWCGESMGSLIVTHALCEQKTPSPDRVILLAPVVSLRPHLPLWKHKLANTISYILPRFRVSLNQFSGEQAVKVTQGGDSHDEQAATNSYFIEKFTLRLLATLGNLISGMHSLAQGMNCPIMVINGGHDYFTPPENALEFYKHIPPIPGNEHVYYPDSYHLLMYDSHREQIFSEISQWISNRIGIKKSRSVN
ncbi:MAG: alpha/beta fold hydrolase [Akkermansiaceae bacterium]